MATGTIITKQAIINCTGTTDANGLMVLRNIPSGFYPIYAINYNKPTIFFNGSVSAKSPYVRITNSAGSAWANQEVDINVVCLGVGGGNFRNTPVSVSDRWAA